MKSTLATRVSSTRFFAIGRVSRREDSTTDTRSTLSKVRERASTESRDKTQRIISLSLDTRLVSTVIGTFESSGNSAAKKGGVRRIVQEHACTVIFTERIEKRGHGQSRNEWPLLERRVVVSRYSPRTSTRNYRDFQSSKLSAFERDELSITLTRDKLKRVAA